MADIDDMEESSGLADNDCSGRGCDLVDDGSLEDRVSHSDRV